MTVAIEAESATDTATGDGLVGETDAEIDPAAPDLPDTDDAQRIAPAKRRLRSTPQRLAISVGLIFVVAMAMLAGLLGFRDSQSHRAQAQRSQFLQVARQGALNLTTIDWQHAENDVRRILDGATGPFYDDFAKRSEPFIEMLKQAKTTTVGTITEAALESETADKAEALVAVSVQTSTAGETAAEPRAWRMRISVQRVGDQVKVSDVGFVQ